ncbi:MAG: sporulation protein YabP [Limnochordales bacterium]|nr:sporulation protein YabP [Limnochordales bacterium]
MNALRDPRLATAAGVPVAVRHQIVLRNRESLALEGVTNVESFDEEEVVLETVEGLLVIRGEGLHIKEFNVEKATLSMDGLVRSLEYASQQGQEKARGFLSRLFR